jgi:hypothetical protein
MRTRYRSSASAGMLLAVMLLVPVLLVAGVTGQLGFVIVVATSLLAATPVPVRLRRAGVAPPVFPRSSCLAAHFDRPPPPSL